MGDHPRSRGEHVETSLGDDGHLWIIPARAGSTTTWRQPRPHPRDHPRSRGEHARPMEGERANRGSSPLARGARIAEKRKDSRRRIIPARAGSTRGVCGRRWGAGDHPRSRGEHMGTRSVARLPRGSSPLARGARPAKFHLGGRNRIIPARAGSTRVCASSDAERKDHPRSRGEHDWQRLRAAIPGGSSPLARGALPERRMPCGMFGIIPARAGSTDFAFSELLRGQDHPRSRGEHLRVDARVVA